MSKSGDGNMRHLLLAAATVAMPVMAGAFEPVTARDDFVGLVDGRELRLGLFGIALTISPAGTIDGSASGWPVTGTWAWEDGFFCRQMDWGGTEIPYNCQLVEVRGGDQLRFTVDRGAGETATFALR